MLAVGEEGIPLVVHESLLCAHSIFFRLAIKEEWKEGQERNIPLPDDRLEVVMLYVQWIYHDKVLSHGHSNIRERDTSEFDRLINGFLFGEKVQDGRFKDAVIDAVIACAQLPDPAGHRSFPAQNLVERAYQGTLEGSPLRRLLADIWSRYAQEKWFGPDMNPAFLLDLTHRLLPMRQLQPHSHPSEGRGSSCIYHHHTDQQSCYRNLAV